MIRTLIAAIALLLTASVCSAMNFSADFVSKMGAETTKGKIFFTDKKVRMELPGMVTITRMDKSIMWMLMPGQKTYMEQKIKPEHSASYSTNMDGEMERVKIGPEKVNGINTDKYRVTFKQGSEKTTVFQWVSKDYVMPIRTAALDNSWFTEYRNIKKTAPKASLFDLPKGYKKFSMNVPGM